MFRNRRLAYAQLARDEQAAETVFDEISIALRRQMSFRILQPFHNLELSIVTERLNEVFWSFHRLRN